MKIRKTLRLKNYNYSDAGSYFITICTKDREYLFGKIIDGVMELNNSGIIAHKMLQGIPNMHNNIVLDQFVVMPNHLHAIIAIVDQISVGNASEPKIKNTKEIENSTNDIKIAENLNMRSEINTTNDRTKMEIPKIIQSYKSEVTKRIKNISGNKSKSSIWQKSYYDRIIRNEKEFENIQEYIFYNPIKWNLDIENEMNDNSDPDKYYNNIFDPK